MLVLSQSCLGPYTDILIITARMQGLQSWIYTELVTMLFQLKEVGIVIIVIVTILLMSFLAPGVLLKDALAQLALIVLLMMDLNNYLVLPITTVTQGNSLNVRLMLAILLFQMNKTYFGGSWKIQELETKLRLSF